MSLSICFCDDLLEFDVATPLERPLGGTQSALCYLAAAIARRGHRVAVLSRTPHQRRVLGVDCMNIGVLEGGLAQAGAYDIYIFTSRFERFAAAAPLFRPNALRIVWTGDGADQRSTSALSRPEIRDAFDSIVCASNWHRQQFLTMFGAAPARTTMIRYAIGPRFENMFADAAELRAAKAPEPRLVYTSTPFRGLNLLLSLFPSIREKRPEAQMEIYSGMRVYQVAGERDRYRHLYERAKTLAGTRYVGSVAQSELATALRQAAVLAYPNTFAETGCIAAMEALASGLHVVTTDLGALSETCMGFADLLPRIQNPQDVARFGFDFCVKVLNALQRRATDPIGFAERCFDQVRTVNRTSTWDLRAMEWEERLTRWKSAKAASKGA